MEKETVAIAGIDKETLDGICYVFLIFLLGCVVGWIYEEIFYWYTEGLLRNRGILYGPWLPIYGIGVMGIYAMKPVKKYPLVLFGLCMAISAIVEYIIGYVGIYYLGLRLWDYRGLFWNLNGIICLRSVLSFGIMGMVFHYALEPVVKRRIQSCRSEIIWRICAVTAVVFLLDCVASYLFRTPITY